MLVGVKIVCLVEWGGGVGQWSQLELAMRKSAGNGHRTKVQSSGATGTALRAKGSTVSYSCIEGVAPPGWQSVRFLGGG